MTTTNKVDLLDTVEFDDEGFLARAEDWSPELAFEIAEVLDLELTERHWLVINFARSEFEGTGEAPTLRKITKETPVSTKELYKLFPGGPAKIAAKISGLKKPTGCI